MEHLLHENLYTSIGIFHGKASFISKQPEKNGQVHNYKLVGGSTQLHIHSAGPQLGVLPIPVDCPASTQFSLRVETKKGELKMPMIPLLSKHAYFRKEDIWSQLHLLNYGNKYLH